jgi:hypothetical protein
LKAVKEEHAVGSTDRQFGSAIAVAVVAVVVLVAKVEIVVGPPVV